MSEEHFSEPKQLQWGLIGAIAGSDVSKVVTGIPIIGYLLLFNDGFVGSISFKSLVGIEKPADAGFLFNTTLKLRFAFFGSLFVLFANFLFRFFGPVNLLKYETDIRFSEAVISGYSREEIIALEADITDVRWRLRTRLLTHQSRNGVKKKAEMRPTLAGYINREAMLRDRNDLIPLVAREWWAGQMHTYPIARYGSLLAMMIGYFLLALPTIDILQAVLRNIFF